MLQNTEDPHRGSIPNKPSYEQPTSSCIYEEAARAKSEQMQRPELSVNVPCCNVHLYPKENEHHPKFEAAVTSSQGPKLLVDYDNFPPNKTIGPEMKVVIPPIPSLHSKLSRSSQKENGCHLQYPHVRAMGDGFSHFSPIHATEAQDLSDSDSDWESEAMVGFGGFMWPINSKNSWYSAPLTYRSSIDICLEWNCIYCKIVIKCLIALKKKKNHWLN